MSAPSIQFDIAFLALTDYRPLGWQRRLFDRLRSGQEIPRVCDLPTGLGKTSVISIWTIALAQQLQDGAVALPRRLIYIVNRRTVVDQATRVVEQIRERLLAPDAPHWSKHEETLRAIAGALRRLAPDEELPIAISTLRGERADNEEWKADPTRPAIIIGTIDMIGSKLLFSGYGDGRYWRAQHAGLVGQDSLIVHDEAHLTPAFSDLLHQLADIQCQDGEPRPVHVMELSATSRGGSGPILKLEPQDEEDIVVKDRLDAEKHLYLHKVGKDSVIKKLVELSTEHDCAQAKVLIYVRSPEDAQDVADQLDKQLGGNTKNRIDLLTGTIRGHERENFLLTSPVYRAFLDPSSHVDRTVYLVSTSTGEVGIDMDADHIVCDITTLDSMIQRLGRVNRRGGRGRKARVDVVMQTGGQGTRDKLSEIEQAVEETRGILDDWASKSNGAIDVSPRNLRELLENLGNERKDKAFAPKPATLPLTDVLLDAWSLTTITKQMPGRPEVASYLHGLTNDPPETYIVWRKEVILLHEAKSELDEERLGDWFQACRIEARERLRDRTDRVKKTLGDLLKAHRRKDEHRDFPVLLLNERGEAEWSHLSSIVENRFNLAYRTIVLPVGVGGLNHHGALDAKASEAVTDVAEGPAQEYIGRRRERWLHIENADGPPYKRLFTEEVAEALPPDLRERESLILQQPTEGDEEQGQGRSLLLMVQPRQLALEHAETAKIRQTLDFHLDQIAKHMNRIIEALRLEKEIGEALVWAAKWHDRGKDRPVWQRYACNTDPLMPPLAKSKNYLHPRALSGYRHEFGSLLDAMAPEKEIQRHAETDLILHLIAAHHGWARPHFERNAWRDNTRTTTEIEEAATEVMQRFGRLQQRFGRWGLAWLEALVRCADIAASQREEVGK